MKFQDENGKEILQEEIAEQYDYATELYEKNNFDEADRIIERLKQKIYIVPSAN